MTGALHLRRTSVAEIAVRNSLFQGGLHIAFTWLGREWECSMWHSRAARERDMRIQIDWGGSEAVLHADLQLLEMATRTLLQESDVSALPPQLRLALLETAFDELADQLQAASKKHVCIKDVQVVEGRVDSDVHFAEPDRMRWTVACDDYEFDGELVLDALGMSIASATRRAREYDPRTRLALPELPVTMQFIVGNTTVSLSALSSIQVRDVIVLDESWMRQDTLTVMVTNNAIFRVRISGARLVVTEGLTKTMDDSFDDIEYSTGEIVNDLPIKLTFDLGERTLPLGELQTIAPGYVFDLGRDFRQAVTIRANGMRIGEGELVDIEGRTGVAVLFVSGRPE